MIRHLREADGAPLSATVIIPNLCDIVSKNGNLLLNVGPRADGSLPDDQRDTLRSVGRWLETNGEAIYGTRPWRRFGEGPTHIEPGDFHENTEPLCPRDIRFTSRNGPDGEIVCAIVMGWPPDGKVRIASIASAAAVTLVETAAALDWHSGPDGITVHLPAQPLGRHAHVLRIDRPQVASSCPEGIGS